MPKDNQIKFKIFKEINPITAILVDVQYFLFIYTLNINKFVTIEYPTKSPK